MSAGGEWPMSLRQQVSDELKTLIFQAFQDGSLHTRDWKATKLKSLSSALPPRPLKKRPAESVPLSAPTYAAAAADTPVRRSMPMVPGLPAPPPPPPRPPATPATPAKTPGRHGRGSKAQTQGKGRKGAARASAADASTRAEPAAASAEEARRREKRLRRFEEEQAAFQREQQADMHSAIATTSLAGRLAPGMRGTDARMRAVVGAMATPPSTPPDPNVIDWDEHTVVGTSTKLEKPYLRLTSAPDPKTVRPLTTLRDTLELLKGKWRAEHNYAYICDQFKSMRQDLTVQRIKNDFTVKVYEIHARIALEKGDLGEYNQCQTQLRSLYAYGLRGSVLEFLAYRILYLLHTRNQREVNALMTELTPAMKHAPCVAHALAVRTAMHTGNFHRFFRLYYDAPNMNAYIMDHFVERARVQALAVVSRSFRPSCPLAFLVAELGWDSPEDADAFLSTLGAAVYTPPHGPLLDALWDAKAASAPLALAADRFRKVDVWAGADPPDMP
ncbi:hypothetical protein MSPP1_004117 [Malassezia sp. CBS 17886]|nr:hypothetical protein MSPP1_004117 [Malassezia sp. CBS 17886]